MTGSVGDVILVLRRAADITQVELASRLGITQAALSRYENDLREPDDQVVERLGDALGVTTEFLRHEFRMQGAIAADAHMRRQKTTKPSDWKRVEARLNAFRMHSTYLLDRVPLRPQNRVLRLDPDEHTPSEVAGFVRAAWRMPVGPVRKLTRWTESAGIIVIEEDFGTHRIDGMSQWAGDHAVIILNAMLPTDRKRLTIAHELGHLVLHGDYVDGDMEEQANLFAAEFLMPEHVIAPQLMNLTLGKLSDLKSEWGVSMQAIFERAYRLGKASGEERQRFYRQMNARGWKTREPGSDLLAPEHAELAATVGRRLGETGLTRAEILRLVGARDGYATPFLPPAQILRAV
ncbi:helix-turn-helix domain-containing protein [Agrococcus sp. KRD186]|uniref:helix-turn-helix domain-containing protein n=1 Tax=Agrococcus sp. KRD186 TaxID=2729730 RepID=UPI0019D17F8F|nr:XRE family transcriptional regulator [Agrococcus sp. KRD186]